MRRALVTARPTLPPFVVGNPAISRVSPLTAGTVRAIYDNPAPRSGIITSVDMYSNAAGNVHIFTATLSGSTLTVTAATGPLAVASGANTFSASLPISSGGFICMYIPGSTNLGSAAATGGNSASATTSTVPTAGQTYTMGAAGTVIISLQGTGS